MKKELTIKDVTLSETSLLNEQQFNTLFKATPASQVYTRPAKGGGEWPYVKGAYVKKVLNFISGFNWDFEIMKEHLLIDAGQVVLLGKLTVRLGGESVVKMQYGRADIKFKRGTRDPLDVGNDFKSAATDALKKCASEFGVAQDIYGKESFRPVHLGNTPVMIGNEAVLKGIQGCLSSVELDQYYADHKAEITKDIALVSAVGFAKKQFEDE